MDCERIVSEDNALGFGDWLRADLSAVDPFFFIPIDVTSDLKFDDIDPTVMRGVVIGSMTHQCEADLENDLATIIALEVIHATILLAAVLLIIVRAVFSKSSAIMLLIFLPNTNSLYFIGFSNVFSVKLVSIEVEIITSLYCRLLEFFYPVILELLTPIISAFLLGLGETSILDDNQMEALSSCSGNSENLFDTSSLADSDAGLSFEVDNGNALVGIVGFVGDCCLGLNKGFVASSHYLAEGCGDVIDMSNNFAVDGFVLGNASVIMVLVVANVSISSKCLLVPPMKRNAGLGSLDKSEEGEADETMDMQGFLILEIADEGDVLRF